MSGLKHDAKVCRDHAKSEVIRRSHGWLTPEEVAEEARVEDERRKAAAKIAVKGTALLDVE